jgi:peptidyl-prolyl cis-trans isomerase C
MKISHIAACSTLALLAACGAKTSTTAATPAVKPVATVNGRTISRETFEYVAKNVAGKASAELTVKERDQLLDDLVRSEVIAQQAEKDGLDKKGDAEAALSLARLQLLQTASADAYMKDRKSTEAEIKAEYDAQVEALGKLQFKAHHILVKTEAEALAALARINKGEKFEAVAKAVSTDTSKTTGGDLGDFFNAGSMVPPFAAALQTLKKGEITAKPVQSEFGFHLIRLDDTRPTVAPPYDAVKDRVDQIVQQKKFKTFGDDLLKTAKVEKSL